MNYKERQDWLKEMYPLTVITDRYSGTYSGAAYLAFPLDFDEVPEDVNGDDTECAYFWKNYEEPVGKGASIQDAINDLAAQMKSDGDKLMQWLTKYSCNSEEILAWLKEQKINTEEVYCRGYDCGYQAGYADAKREQKPIGTDFRTEVKNLMNLHKIKNKFTEEDYDFHAKELLELAGQKPAEIDERKIINKHITEDSLSSEVNKRLKECGWYVTDEKPVQWNEDIIRKAVKEVGLTQYQIDWFKTNVFLPKQEWSDEDEKMLVAISKALGCDTAEKILENEGVTLMMAAGFLGSLRPQQKPSDLPAGFYFIDKNGKKYYSDTLKCGNLKFIANQKEQKHDDATLYAVASDGSTIPIKQKSAEWDEFDEDCLKRAIWYVENPGPSVVKDTNLVLWLNSLRSRLKSSDKWKPSEKQIDIFESAIDTYIPDYYVPKSILTSLLQDLKKRM